MEEHCSHRQMTSEDVPVIIGVIIKPLNKGHLGGTKCYIHRDVPSVPGPYLEVTQPLSLLHKVAPHQ